MSAVTEPRATDGIQRGFGLSTCIYVVIASMVGTGVLTTSGYIVKDVGSHSLMVLLWLVGGSLALCGALSVAELAAAMPHAGGEYVFIREAYGRVAAFLYGWITYLIGFSAPTALSAYAASRYLVEGCVPARADSADAWIRGLAALIVIVFTAVHLRGQAFGSWAQSITTLLKIVVLIALVVAAFAFGRGDPDHFRMDLPANDMPWSKLGIALVFVMFSYTGWNASTYLAGEVRDASRLLPQSLLLGCGGVIALYVLLNLVYVYALSTTDIARLSTNEVEPIAALAANRLFGPWVARPLALAIGLGLLATVSAYILTGPRVYYAMAQDGLFPAFAGRLSPSTGSPNAAILTQSGCTLLLLISGGFRSILTYAGVGLSLSAFFVILAVPVLRIRRPNMPRPFRTPAYPLVPLVFLVVTAWTIVFAFQAAPMWSAISVCSILAGVPIYFAWQASQGNVITNTDKD